MAAERRYCDWCGEPTEQTDELVDAWQHVCPDNHDTPDFCSDTEGVWWTLTPPKRVRLRKLTCGCVELV